MKNFTKLISLFFHYSLNKTKFINFILLFIGSMNNFIKNIKDENTFISYFIINL